MRNRIEQMAKGKFSQKKGNFAISVKELYLEVEEGTHVTGSFSIFSNNLYKITGYVFVTNHHMKLLSEPTFQGIEYEIKFRFYSDTLKEGMNEQGKFLFLTDCGEVEVPFVVSCMQKGNSVDMITDFESWKSLLKISEEEAFAIFVERKKMNSLLREQKSIATVYRQVIQSVDKKQAFEHFLICIQEKQPVRLQQTQKEIQIQSFKKEYTISLTQQGEGYIEGEVWTDSNRIQLPYQRLSQYERKDGSIFIPFTVCHHLLETQEIKDKIYICDGINTFEYTIFFPLSEEGRRLKKLKKWKQKEKKDFIFIYKSWFAYVTGNLEREEYEKRRQCIEKEGYENWNWNPEVEYEKFREDLTRDDSSIEEKQIKYDTYYEDTPVVSSFFYYEMVKDRNQQWELVQELTNKEINIILWGIQYQYVTEELANHIMSLIQHQRKYSGKIEKIAKGLYATYPTRENLQILCSYLMRTARVEEKYHIYYESAVKCYMKLLGLFEYYIRSLKNPYQKKIPRSVLLYLLDSENLSDNEQELLYCNLFYYENEYDTMLYHYSYKIQKFLKAQMEKGRINDRLAYLYQKVYSRILQKEEMLKVFPNVLFKHKVVCHNPNMVGVFVYHKESKQVVYTPLYQGEAYIDLYTKNYSIIFQNQVGNRFVTGIHYEVKPVFESVLDGQLFHQWNQEHEMLLYHLLSKGIEEREDKVLAIGRKVLELESISDEFYWELLWFILVCYDEQYDQEMVRQYLQKVNLTFYCEDKRIQLIEKMICYEQYDLSIQSIKEYSCVGIATERLEKVIHYLEETEQDEELLYQICNICFEQEDCKEYSLEYLANASIRPLKEMLLLWRMTVQQGVCIPQLEENIVTLALFEQEFSEEICQVFLSYFHNHSDQIVNIAFIRYVLVQCLLKERQILPELYVIGSNYVLEGKICDRETLCAFLYQCARLYCTKNKLEHTDFVEGIPIKWIRKKLYELEFYGMDLNIFGVLRQHCGLQAKSQNYHLIEYRGLSGNSYEVEYCFIEWEKRKKVQRFRMKEILSGLYVIPYILFVGERLEYRILDEENNEVERGEMKYHSKWECLDGEYRILNEISQEIREESAILHMKQYIKCKTIFENQWNLLE